MDWAVHCRFLCGFRLHRADMDEVAELTGSYFDRVDGFPQLQIAIPDRFHLQRQSCLRQIYPKYAKNLVILSFNLYDNIIFKHSHAILSQKWLG